MDSSNNLSEKNKTLLRQFESKWLALFQLIESAYKADFIKDWKTTRRKFFQAHAKAVHEFVEKHKIDKINLAASEETYSMRIAKNEERISMSLSNPHPFRKVGSPQGLLYNNKEITPFLSQKDIGYVEGLIQGWKDFEFGRNRERTEAMPNVHKEFSYIASLIEDTNTIDQMLADKKTLKETLLSNPEAAKIISENPDIEQMVDAFSDNLDYSKKTLNTRNPNVGINSKNRADQFAIDMGEHLKALEDKGITSTRKIADKLNELEIPSNFGKKWSHNSVAVLLRRREAMGLNDVEEGSEPKIPTMD